MKRSPELRRVVERMAPGVLARDGFLGDDPRPLEEILDADRSAVAGLGTSHEELAGRLRDAFERARAGLGTAVCLEGGLSAVCRETMGRIPCPWGGCGVFPKGEVELTDARVPRAGERSGEKLLFTALSVHLIAAHGFYQGRGSRYRLEPAVLARLFRLSPT